MKRLLVAFVLLVSSNAIAGEQLVSLAMQVYSNGELVSEPRMAARPGTDASLMQGIEAAGFDEELMLKVLFHEIESTTQGAEMVIDTDFGMDAPRHLSNYHVTMPWHEPYEFSFQLQEDAPTIRIVVTPSLVDREDLLRREK